MKSELSIFIPSISRWDKKIKPLKQLELLRKHTTIAVPPDQVKKYSSANPKWKIAGIEAKGIASTRQAIIEKAETKYVLFIDDDLRFNVRYWKGDKPRLRPATPEDMVEMVMLIQEFFAKDELLAQVGISVRQNNFGVEEKYLENSRAIQSYAFDVKKLRSIKARFNDVLLMEDMHITLSLLEAGYKNLIIFTYSQGQDESNAAGGCSTYRTPEAQAEAALLLSELHPHAVKLVRKSAWKGFGKSRLDVNVNWKSAYRPRGKAGIFKRAGQ